MMHMCKPGCVLVSLIQMKSIKGALKLTSRYHLDSHTWVEDATARTGFSATNEMMPLTRLYRFSVRSQQQSLFRSLDSLALGTSAKRRRIHDY